METKKWSAWFTTQVKEEGHWKYRMVELQGLWTLVGEQGAKVWGLRRDIQDVQNAKDHLITKEKAKKNLEGTKKIFRDTRVLNCDPRDILPGRPLSGWGERRPPWFSLCIFPDPLYVCVFSIRACIIHLFSSFDYWGWFRITYLLIHLCEHPFIFIRRKLL